MVLYILMPNINHYGVLKRHFDTETGKLKLKEVGTDDAMITILALGQVQSKINILE